MKERPKKKKGGYLELEELPFCHATKHKNKTSDAPSSLRSSLSSNRDSKTPPPPYELSKFSPQSEKKKKKLAKNSKKQMWFPRHKDLDLLKFLALER